MEENGVKAQQQARSEPPRDGDMPEGRKGAGTANRVFKAAMVGFSALFLLILGSVLFVYFKVSALRNMPAPAEANYQYPVFGAGRGRLPAPSHMHVSTRPAETSALTGFVAIQELAQGAYERTEDARNGKNRAMERNARKAVFAFKKYADRPIVKDFIAAAKKDPDFAQALKDIDPGDPLALADVLREMENMKGLMLKFAMRKDFLPFLREVANDPDIKPMIVKPAAKQRK